MADIYKYQISLIIVDDASTEDFLLKPALFDKLDSIVSIKNTVKMY